MSPRRWLLTAVLALAASAAGTGWWVLATEAGSRWLLAQAASRLPGLALGEVSGSLVTGLRLTGLGYRDPDGTELRLAELSVDWRPWALLRGELHLARLAAGGLELRLVDTDGAAAPAALPSMAVPLPVVVERLSLEQGSILRGAEHWRLDRLRTALRLDGEALQLSALQLQGEGVQLSGEGRVGAVSPHPVAAALDWRLARDELPALAGQLQVGGDLQVLTVEQQLTGAIAAHIGGTIQPDLATARHRFALRGTWSQLALQVAGDELVSDRGSLSIAGELNDYRYQLSTQLQHAATGRVAAELSGTGDAQQLRIASGSLRGWGGELALSGSLAWSPLPAWDLALRARGIDPATRWPEWTGTVDGEGRLSGRLADGDPELALDITALHGRLRGYPVAARGQLSLAQGRWRARDLSMRSGDNRLAVDGTLLPRLDLALELDAPQLVQLAPGISGRLQGHARLDGEPDQLRAQLELRGAELSTAGLRARALLVSADIDPADAQRSRWQFVGEGLGYGDWQAQRLQVDGTGNAAEHRFTGHLEAPQLTAGLTGSGAYRQDRWRGELTELTLLPVSLGRWTLASAVAVDAGPDQLQVARLCLTQADARVCAQGSREADGRLAAQADWQGVPLALLRPWLALDAELSGDLAGSARLSGKDEWLDGDASLRLAPGMLRYRPDAGPEITAEHREGHAELSYRGDRLEVVAGLRVGDQGAVEGRGSLGPAQAAGRALDGELALTLPDPAPLAVLVPQVAALSGPLQLNSRWRGTAAQPRVSLDGSWRNGEARVPELGVKLTGIDVQLSGDGDRLRLAGQASSGPGRVQLDGELQLDSASGWPLRLRLDGQDFEVARRADLEARVSPVLDITLARGQIDARGRLAVPYARITAKELGRGAVRSSADEVILAAGEPSEAAQPDAALRAAADIVLALGEQVHLDAYGLTTRLTGELRLHQAPGGVAEGAGQLQLVDGRYKAYGQDLTIDAGRLLFSGPLDNPELDVRASRKAGNVTAGLLLSGALQTPSVQLFSEPPMEQAEILSYLMTGGPMSGSSSVSPLMLTQAAVGLGLDKSGELTGQLGSSLGLDELKVESGTAGLEGSVMAIGKQLSPNLYLRYLYGLFDSAASVQIRYLVSDHVRLEGQAGQQRAVDLIYELEKD